MNGQFNDGIDNLLTHATRCFRHTLHKICPNNYGQDLSMDSIIGGTMLPKNKDNILSD